MNGIGGGVRKATPQDHRNVVAGAIAGLGGAIAIGVMEGFSFAAHYPLAVIRSPPRSCGDRIAGRGAGAAARPGGGHLISALSGSPC